LQFRPPIVFNIRLPARPVARPAAGDRIFPRLFSSGGRRVCCNTTQRIPSEAALIGRARAAEQRSRPDLRSRLRSAITRDGLKVFTPAPSLDSSRLLFLVVLTVLGGCYLFFSPAFTFAHLAFCAAEILARAAADMTRLLVFRVLFVTDTVVLSVDPGGRPCRRPRLTVVWEPS
jgi:hypothetical protein